MEVKSWKNISKCFHIREALIASAKDHGGDEAAFREDLMNIARTTLSSKILAQHKDYFAKMTVDAVLRLKKSGNLDAIQITRVHGGTLEDSFLDEGEDEKNCSSKSCNTSVGHILFQKVIKALRAV